MSGSLVPVTVVGGYLGAGKTTMIAELLRGAGGRRLAVLVNDFGSLNLDAALLRTAGEASSEGAGAAEIVELTNGCVCCSLTDALGEGLDRVLTLEPRPDQIIIEASGVADPAKIAVYGRGWPGVRLDAVVTVVSVADIRDQADDRFVGTTVRRQLRAADLLALSCVDLVTGEAARATRSWLTTVSDVPQVELDLGLIAPEIVLDTAVSDTAVSSNRAVHDTAVSDTAVSSNRAVSDTAVSSNTVADASDRFRSITVDLDGAVNLARLAELLDGWPSAVVRVKGLVTGPDGRWWVVHRVGGRWSIEPAPGPGLSHGGLVVIVAGGAEIDSQKPDGQPLNAGAIQRALLAGPLSEPHSN